MDGTREAIVLATEHAKDVAAIGVPDPIKGTAIVCVCVARGDGGRPEQAIDDISRAVVAGLGTAFRPKQVVFVPDLPRTQIGRVHV